MAAAEGESRTLFVGGIPARAHEEDLRTHFARIGEVRSIVVMRDRETGQGRGFGFVEFEEEADAAKALGEGERHRHLICGRLVDVKRARARLPRYQGEQPSQQKQLELSTIDGNEDNQSTKNHAEDSENSAGYSSKKVFVGGLRDSITEEDFRAYFQAFGAVTDAVVMYDRVTCRSRGFGFVTFDSEEAVRKVMQKSSHELHGAKVDAKIAIPKGAQYYRNVHGRGSTPFGERGPAPLDGTPYQLCNDHHVFYNGYMPQPVPAHQYYPGFFYGMGGYPYANAYPNQGVTVNAPNMLPMRPVYNSTYTPMHQGYGFPYVAGYPGAAAPVQYGVNGAGHYTNDQGSVDIQEVDSTATRLEYMKLGSQ